MLVAHRFPDVFEGVEVEAALIRRQRARGQTEPGNYKECNGAQVLLYAAGLSCRRHGLNRFGEHRRNRPMPQRLNAVCPIRYAELVAGQSTRHWAVSRQSI